MTRVLLAYSGGLRSSLALARLTERPRTEVVTMTLDLGERTEVAGVRERALALGAVRAHVLDAREEFARDFVFPSILTGVPADVFVPFTAALTSAIVVSRLQSLSAIEDSATVAWGSPATSDAARCLATAMEALAPELAIQAPLSGDDPDAAILAEAQRRQLTRSGHALSSGQQRVPDLPLSDDFGSVRHASSARASTIVDLMFTLGRPVAVNGVSLHPVELLESLNTIGGSSAIAILAPALVALRERIWTPAMNDLSATLASRYRSLVLNGEWFGDAREAIAAAIGAGGVLLNGSVRVSVEDGTATVLNVDAASPVRPRRASLADPLFT